MSTREEKEKEKKERFHVQDMIEKWGAHRWQNMVCMTDDDCLTAKNLRYEDEERYYEEWKRERIEEKKYVVEQTANLSEKDKRLWILEYEHQKNCEIDWDMDDSEMMQRQNKEDAERLAAWEAKNNK